MKTRNKILMLLTLAVAITLSGCGPIIISSRPDVPPPSWFYPNRVETVRYVYFPDYLIYYDLSIRSYVYLENGVWITIRTLPDRYNSINFDRSRFIRIQDYHGDNISRYHTDVNRGRSSTGTKGTRKN